MISRVKSEVAVSPVIGTILLVAITIVLIAIVTAVVMGMANLSGKKEVGLTVTPYYLGQKPTLYNPNDLRNTNGVVVIFHGGKDFPDLKNVSVLINNDGTYNGTYPFDSRAPGQFYYLNENVEIGKAYRFRLPMTPGGTGSDTELTDALVVVTGTFTDGTEQILSSSRLNIPWKYNE